MNLTKWKITVFGLLLWTGLFGQGVLEEEWYITREGIQMAKDVAWGVDLDETGNIYWTTSQTTFGGNRKDIYTYKLNQDGAEIWDEPHIYGDNFEQQSYNCVFKNGILYVAGRTWSGPLITSSNALVMAIDTAIQDTLWTYVWDGGYGYEEVDGLVIEEDGLYISGWSWGETTNQDAFISKLDLMGNHIWTTTWGSPNYDQCDGHCVVDDSTVYICGLYDLSTGGDAYLAAFNKSTGAYKWHTLWGGGSAEDALGMESDGTFIYQCGNTSSFSDSTVFVNKYDKNGELIWTMLTEKAIKTRSLAFADDVSLYLAATSNTIGEGGDELIIMKIDKASGELQSYRTWGGSEDDIVHDIRIREGVMYLTGRTISFSDNDEFDAFLIKAPLFDFGSLEVNIKNEILLYPNPNKGDLFLDVPAGLSGRFILADLSGKQCLSLQLNSEVKFLDISNLQSGIYYWQLHTPDGGIHSGRLVLEN